MDDFDRALQVDAGPGADAYRQGVELIHKQLQDLLARRGVTPIEAVGAARSTRTSTRRSPTSRAPATPRAKSSSEVRRGYKLGDRLLRPAMVKVAKA